MCIGRFGVLVGTVVAFLLGSGQPALADIIDGNWCSQDGRRLSIDGRIVVTPGGSRLTGAYDRHHLIFKLPLFENHGGKEVDVVLVSANVIRVRYSFGPVEADETPPEEWKRCKEPLS